LEILHHGQLVRLMANEPQELSIPSFAPLTGRPSQPVGREPDPVSEHG
jgi:hypothetical protein